jgi:hypothetical protein
MRKQQTDEGATNGRVGRRRKEARVCFFATMGSLWRSQEMQLIQLYIQKDAAHDTVDELGELGMIQFHDVRRKKRDFPFLFFFLKISLSFFKSRARLLVCCSLPTQSILSTKMCVTDEPGRECVPAQLCE